MRQIDRCSQSAIPDLLTSSSGRLVSTVRCSQSAIPDLLTSPQEEHDGRRGCSQSAIPDLLTWHTRNPLNQKEDFTQTNEKNYAHDVKTVCTGPDFSVPA